MNNSKTLFSQSIDLTDDYLSFEYVKGVTTSVFDTYRRENDLGINITIYHYANDIFKVSVMNYDDSTGCTVGTQDNLGEFNNIYDAEDCVETYLKDVLIDLGV